MSEENVEIVGAVYADWANGDLRIRDELLAPDAAFEPDVPEGRPILDREALPAFMRDFLAQWRDFRVATDGLVDLGDSVLVTERQRAFGKASGVKTEMTSYAIWTLRDGLVARVRWFTDRSEALEAAGLSE